MISKRHITARGHSVLAPKNPSPMLIGGAAAAAVLIYFLTKKKGK